MQCVKSNSLQATADTEHLLADSFILEGQLADVYVYPHEIRIIQKAKNKIIPIKFGLSFGVVQGQDKQPEALELHYGDEKIKLERNFWPRAMQWENTLLKHLIRTDFHSFFKPIRKIGRGNFASVYLAEDTRMKRNTAVKAFMKEVALKGESRASLQNQIQIMRKLKHPNLIQFYGAYESKNSLYLSIEYAEGITLQSFLRRNPKTTVQQRRKIMKGLLLGLKQLARLRILHRDLKPENIIISPDCQSIKILDFGLATYIHELNYIFIRCGTPGYVAPQILRIRDLQRARLGVQSDMFSLGAIYFQLIYGYPLFKGKSNGEVLLLNRQANIKLNYKQNLGFDELQLLQGMLQVDPCVRITPQKALKSLFFLQRGEIFYRALQPLQHQETSSLIFD